MHIHFQGDSITDVGRNATRGSMTSIGQGYPLLIHAQLSARFPQKYHFTNAGISGNRIVDVYARIKQDTWNLHPDFISILIGINDVWHEADGQNGVDARRFYNVYRMLVDDTMRVLPGVKMLLMEPFVVKGSATEAKWDYFRDETVLRREAVCRIAEETNQFFLPLQELFDEACKVAPAQCWIADGVHPTPAGHQLIADAWIKKFEEMF